MPQNSCKIAMLILKSLFDAENKNLILTASIVAAAAAGQGTGNTVTVQP